MLITPRDGALTASFLHGGQRSSVEMKSSTSQVRAMRFWTRLGTINVVADRQAMVGLQNGAVSSVPHTLTERPASLAKATGPKITLDAYCGDEIGS